MSKQVSTVSDSMRGNKNASKVDRDKVTGKGRMVLDLEHWSFIVRTYAKETGVTNKLFVMQAIQHYVSHLNELEN